MWTSSRSAALVLTMLIFGSGGCGRVADAVSAPSPISERLVWSDEFDQASAGNVPPSPKNWVGEAGDTGWGNHELEMYCAPGSDAAPCHASAPNSFVAPDGMLHIVARREAAGGSTRYTSARLKSQGLQSFQYGRMEARIRIPGGQGIWPAFWMLGDDISTHPWPACGEIDIMESIGAREPGTVHGSLHGPGFPAAGLTGRVDLPGVTAFSDAFHTFGALWSPGEIRFYVDDPSKPYATFHASDLAAPATWPFDGRKFFFLLNVAAGGDWPGAPSASTPLPAEMLVDYVRVWQRSPTAH